MRKIALFDKPLPYAFNKHWGGWEAKFTTQSDQEVVVNIYKEYKDRVLTKTGPVKIRPRPVRLGIVFSVGGFTQMTGKGESVQILSTVVSICREALVKERMAEDGRMSIRFDAKVKDKGRVVLYHKLAVGLNRELGGDLSTEQIGDKVYYEIVIPAAVPETIIPIEPHL